MSDLTRRPKSIPVAADVLATLRAHEGALRAAGIQSMALFGSVARGDADPDSDVDLAVKFDPAAHVDLVRLVGLEREVGALLARKVDLVPLPVEKMRLRANMERDRKDVF